MSLTFDAFYYETFQLVLIDLRPLSFKATVNCKCLCFFSYKLVHKITWDQPVISKLWVFTHMQDSTYVELF
jgi:hypothetical protein